MLVALKAMPKPKSHALAYQSHEDIDLTAEEGVAISLAKASEVAVIDDPYLAKLFCNEILRVPEVRMTAFAPLTLWRFALTQGLHRLCHVHTKQETALEDFYIRLGARRISECVKESYRFVGQSHQDSKLTTSIKNHLLERLAVFMSSRSRSCFKVDLPWLRSSSGRTDNLKVIGTDDIQLTRELKMEQSRSILEHVTAAHTLKGNGQIAIYVSSRKPVDMYE